MQKQKGISKKTQAHKAKSGSQRNANGMKGFGRPKNSPIEIGFMEKIRGPKLQAISAESLLELALFDDTAIPQADAELSLDSKLLIKNKIVSFFLERDEPRFIQMLEEFELAVKNWKFAEIKDENSFPEYLFEDSYDLSFIYHSLEIDQILKTKKRKILWGDELLFCQLLCLNQRGRISEKIVTHILKVDVVDVIADNLDQRKVSIPQSQDSNNHQSEQNSSNQRKISLQQPNYQKDELSVIEVVDQIVSKQKEEKEVNQGPSEGKGKRQRRQLKFKKDQIGKSIDEYLLPIIEKMLTHILWAYFYVHPTESKNHAHS